MIQNTIEGTVDKGKVSDCVRTSIVPKLRQSLRMDVGQIRLIYTNTNDNFSLFNT